MTDHIKSIYRPTESQKILDNMTHEYNLPLHAMIDRIVGEIEREHLVNSESARYAYIFPRVVLLAEFRDIYTHFHKRVEHLEGHWRCYPNAWQEIKMVNFYKFNISHTARLTDKVFRDAYGFSPYLTTPGQKQW